MELEGKIGKDIEGRFQEHMKKQNEQAKEREEKQREQARILEEIIKPYKMLEKLLLSNETDEDAVQPTLDGANRRIERRFTMAGTIINGRKVGMELGVSVVIDVDEQPTFDEPGGMELLLELLLSPADPGIEEYRQPLGYLSTPHGWPESPVRFNLLVDSGTVTTVSSLANNELAELAKNAIREAHEVAFGALADETVPQPQQ